MDYGLINVSLTAVRKAPSEKSEMINQLLFGERIIIHKILNNWLFIESVYDGSSGWVNHLSHKDIEDKQVDANDKVRPLVLPGLTRISNTQRPGEKMYLMPGSEVHLMGKDRKGVDVDGQIYMIEDEIDIENRRNERSSIKDTALSFINIPSIYGGRSFFGMDSPGLVQVIFKIHDIRLPRLTSQQVNIGSTVSFIDDAQPGDVAFFDNELGEIAHVGLILEKHRILHSYGTVRLDKIDHQGIFSEDTGEYTHRLRTIKNVIDQIDS